MDDTIHGFFMNQAPTASEAGMSYVPNGLHLLLAVFLKFLTGLDDDSYMEEESAPSVKVNPMISEENDTIGRFFYTGTSEEGMGRGCESQELVFDRAYNSFCEWQNAIVRIPQ